MSPRFSSEDFWSGCAFTGFGAVTVVLAQSHPVGTAARMGPGYLPTALGIVLAGIGVVMLLKSVATAVSAPDRIGHINVWLLLRALLPIAAFAVLLYPLGLVLTAVIVVLGASWAGDEFCVGEALLNAGVLALLSYVLFIWTLNQTMPAWPWFIAG